MANFTTVFTGKVTAVRPTAEEINNITEGSLAPSPFGDMQAVTRIHYLGDDINGRRFICFYTKFGPTAEISNSLKEGEVLRTVSLSRAHTSDEIRRFDINEKL